MARRFYRTAGPCPPRLGGPRQDAPLFGSASSGPEPVAPAIIARAAGLLEQAFGALAALTAIDSGCRDITQEVVNQPDCFQSRTALKRRLTGLALLYGPLLENSDLIRAGSDEEFFEARGYLREIADWEEPSRSPESLEFLFLLLLALVRSGQRQLLNAVDAMTKRDGNSKDGDRLRIAS